MNRFSYNFIIRQKRTVRWIFFCFVHCAQKENVHRNFVLLKYRYRSAEWLPTHWLAPTDGKIAWAHFNIDHIDVCAVVVVAIAIAITIISYSIPCWCVLVRALHRCNTQHCAVVVYVCMCVCVCIVNPNVKCVSLSDSTTINDK